MRRGAVLGAVVAASGHCGPGRRAWTRRRCPPPNPRLRPARAAAAAPEAAVAAPGEGLAASLRPRARPKALVERWPPPARARIRGWIWQVWPRTRPTRPRPRKARRRTSSRVKKGAVCGVNAIKGEKIAPIKAKVKGCGLQDGVRVTCVSGVRLSHGDHRRLRHGQGPEHLGATTWLQPTYGGKVVELRIAAHYICRSRNNKKGAKISEHGKGKAVDVAGFVLSSGKAADRGRELQQDPAPRPQGGLRHLQDHAGAGVRRLSRRPPAFRHRQLSQRRLLPRDRRSAGAARHPRRLAQRKRPQGHPPVFHHQRHLQHRRIAALFGQRLHPVADQRRPPPAAPPPWRPEAEAGGSSW